MNIWAHRGCSYRYPENTLSSFKEACEYPITGIELDIQLSRDGELVVIHDETVDRTTDGTGKVCDKTLAELKALHIIANEESGLSYETIPTMREVLELLAPECLKRGLKINIELKNSIIRYEGMEQQILALIKEFGVEPYIVYSSFNPDSVALLKELDTSVKTGILAREVSKCMEIAGQIPVDALHPYVKQIDVKDLKANNVLPVRAWNTRQFEPFFPENREIEIQNIEELRELGVRDIFTNAPESYLERIGRRQHTEICLDYGWTINPDTGFAERTEDDSYASCHFYKATAGSILSCENELCRYQLFVYTKETEERLIYSYCYQEEENWASYCKEKSLIDGQEGSYCFKEDCYFRILISNTEKELPPLFRLDGELPEYVWKSYFRDESRRVAEAALKLKDKDSFTVLLITDTHYVVNGTWEDTAYNLKRTAEEVYPDAVIHLGDLTDGMLSAALTKEYAGKVMGDLKKIGVPVYLCLGNHDSNYFKQNPEELSIEECSEYYLDRKEPWYYVDEKDKALRMFFLFSFNQHEKIRYGFPKEELEWLSRTLEETPKEYKVLVFSHVPPLPQIHYWSDAIRNGEELIEILENYHKENDNAVLAMIHGHNHAEQIYGEREFPIISLGCNKIEDFKDRKPEGSVTYDRKRGTLTQDLWDVLVVNSREKKLDFIRFGAGEDKHIKL